MLYLIQHKYFDGDFLLDSVKTFDEILFPCICSSLEEYLEYCNSNQSNIINNIVKDFGGYEYKMEALIIDNEEYNLHYEIEGEEKQKYIDLFKCVLIQNGLEEILCKYPIKDLLDIEFYLVNYDRSDHHHEYESITMYNSYKIIQKILPHRGDVRDPSILDMTKLCKIFTTII